MSSRVNLFPIIQRENDEPAFQYPVLDGGAVEVYAALLGKAAALRRPL